MMNGSLNAGHTPCNPRYATMLACDGSDHRLFLDTIDRRQECKKLPDPRVRPERLGRD